MRAGTCTLDMASLLACARCEGYRQGLSVRARLGFSSLPFSACARHASRRWPPSVPTGCTVQRLKKITLQLNSLRPVDRESDSRERRPQLKKQEQSGGITLGAGSAGVAAPLPPPSGGRYGSEERDAHPTTSYQLAKWSGPVWEHK